MVFIIMLAQSIYNVIAMKVPLDLIADKLSKMNVLLML